MRSGQRSYIPGVGYIQVNSVCAVEIDGLTDADARPDGFETAAALRAEIATLYAADLAAGRRAYRVTFDVLSAAGQAEAREQRSARRVRTK